MADLLDALDNGPHTERVTQVDHGFDDRRVGQRAVDAADETPIDLDRRHREPSEVGERGVPGSEIVEGDLETFCAETL